MSLLKNRSMRFLLGFVLILVLALGSSAIAAFADSGTATVAVTAGGLSETGVTNVQAAPVTLTGDDQLTTYSLGFTVIDARGSGAGWHLTITSTLFDDGHGNQLPSNASNINAAPSATCSSAGVLNYGAGHCSTLTNSVSTYPVAVPAASPAPTTGNEFFGATSSTGMGKWSITPTITVFIPANQLVNGANDSFSSTVTLGIATGP